jgi:hypothetical protein
MVVDKTYWSKEMIPPYGPSDKDIELCNSHKIDGSTLLLGCTHKLIAHTNYQLDIDPWYKAKTVIVGDWKNNVSFYENMVGDGVLNLSKDLTVSVLKMASKYSNRLIVRYFNRKLPEMKIADQFENPANLFIPPNIIKDFGIYSFLVWKFNEKNDI